MTLETILDRWQRRRRRALMGGALGVAAVVLGLLFLPSSTKAPPVHLRIRVIEASADAEPAVPPDSSPLAGAPEELQAP